jgi:hypothetical protein
MRRHESQLGTERINNLLLTQLNLCQGIAEAGPL